MDGTIAPLGDICALARKHGALVFVVQPQHFRPLHTATQHNVSMQSNSQE